MKRTALVVMDGIGLRDETQGNAFKQAETPNLNKLMKEKDFPRLKASGEAVGLPDGYQGNSEVGHLHLGAAKRVPQRLTRIDNAIENNELAENDAIVDALERAEKNNSAVHIAGIISDGGIHGHIRHLEALMEIASEYDVELKVHCFTDGRDVAPKSAESFIHDVKDWEEEYGGEITTVIGRYYCMDRDHNWDRTRKAYNAMASGEGFQYSDPEEAIEKTYEDGDYDYFVQPSSLESFEGIENSDELIFYNFRADRERQIVEAFLKQDFDEFENPVRPNFTSMFRYRDDFENPVVFEKQVVENTVGERIQENGLSQLRITESQKIPHVSYFFNGQRELQFEDEAREFVESDKIKAYDQKPEMHADDITDIMVEAMNDKERDFILLNYPNGDLVGHTGELEAAIKAVETVDRNVGRLVEAARENDYALFLTADHGNCEDMGTEEDPNTSHTLNRVPLIPVNASVDPGEVVEEKELWEIGEVVETQLGIK